MNSSDDESDWDEIEIPQNPTDIPHIVSIEIPLVAETQPQLEHDIEVTLTKAGASSKCQHEEAVRKRQVAARDRLVRLESHKLHAIALLASLSIRNKWLNDDVLKARVLSLVPLPIQHAFTSITKNAHPDPARRGRLFETALSRLVDWFAPSSPLAAQNPYIGRPEGWFRIKNDGHIRSHTFEAAALRGQVLEAREAERRIRREKRNERQAKRARAAIKGKGRARAAPSSGSDSGDESEDADEHTEWYGPESLRSANSIAKHALQRSGSRDMAALVFVTMLRAIGLPTRLVGSLQCVSWSMPKDHWERRAKKKARTETGARLGITPAEDDAKVKSSVPTAPSPKTPAANNLSGNDATPGNASTPSKPGTKRKRSTLTREVSSRGSESEASKPDSIKRVRGSKSGKNAGSQVSSVPHTIKLRRTRPAGTVLGAAPATPWKPDASVKETPTDGPPTLWAEVFSRPDGRWLPVDPVRGIVNRARVFEEQHKSDQKGANKLVYVVGIEEDGYARDVTARYAKNFVTKTAKARARVAAGGRAGKIEWWDNVMRVLRRPYALHRDDVEDAELSHQRALEGLPTSIGAFKNHPIYALERHLRKDEAIFPRTEIAHFRGEPVFPRQNVLSLKTADGWMRQGRMVRSGMQPIKQTKVRASTVRKKRELEMRREEGEGEAMVGMYANWQTDLYIPPPVVDGKIPTNDFGNVDLYVPTMLPAGAVHIPDKGCAKVARKLGIHFADAVIGFEFRKRQATPIIKGIVIAAENEQAFLEAFATFTRSEELREATKRRERVLQRWSRLVQGLRIARRINEQYSTAKPGQTSNTDTGFDNVEPEGPGGFLDDLRDVVKPYNLPEAQHLVPKPMVLADDSDTSLTARLEAPRLFFDQDDQDALHPIPLDTEVEEMHAQLEDASCRPKEQAPFSGPPLTMQQLADQHHEAQTRAESEGSNTSSDCPPALPTKLVGRHQVKTRPRLPRGVNQFSESSDKVKDELDEDEVEYIEAEPTRPTRASRRRRHAPPVKAGGDLSLPSRTLRPRRK